MLKAIHLAALVGIMPISAPAFATNEQVTLRGQSCQVGTIACDPQIVTGTTDFLNLNVGEAYAEVSFAGGGLAKATVGFAPVVADLLDGQYRRSAGAQLDYTFQVKGPTDTIVPLHITAQLSRSRYEVTDLHGAPLSSAYDFPFSSSFQLSWGASIFMSGKTADHNGLFLQQSAGDTFYGSCTDCSSYYNGTTKFVNFVIPVLSNSDIAVSLVALSDLKWYNGFESSVQYASVAAYADPIFTIDDIEFSAFKVVGVPVRADTPPPPGSAVPEPANWAMMLAGFGLIGATLRRRERSARRSPA